MNHPSKEGGLFVSTPIQNIFDICNFFHNIIWISHIKMLYLYQTKKNGKEVVLSLKLTMREVGDNEKSK
jgi:hypothetical protein